MKKAETVHDLEILGLHLELRGWELTPEQKQSLIRHGESVDGTSITRDILIPGDMPLHHLHYVIQKLFGWQNSHLRAFRLQEDDFQRLTGGTVKGWADLVGTYFQPPSESEEDLYWDDEFEGGNFALWLRKKYTGPYRYDGKAEIKERAQAEIRELLAYFQEVDVLESFDDYYERSLKDGSKEIRVLRKAPLAELTLQEMLNSVYLGSEPNTLLERLLVKDILGIQNDQEDEPKLPTTLLYQYDFGDNWEVILTRTADAQDLLDGQELSQEELEEAKRKVITKHQPVCIKKRGLPVLDDVGGLRGFAEFLHHIYESTDPLERKEYLAWGKSQGWRESKVSSFQIL
ncbi:hypothetical protein KCG48_12780 [Proteiniclasticum sp. BAD-10]|uniref:Plasmid pRiA4b Orf3-like domain-containing protein n=1 Tax=Proteiniclasticum sediminis TaxID=2804028 RepID=A0A941CTM7_9CLOT|nr:hypothetical protein [Proteiniclasticum sediminis]MBR0577191.1 hypothetical protein [Proteiniclasticum sediminis]